jgi:hypothetical protein
MGQRERRWAKEKKNGPEEEKKENRKKNVNWAVDQSIDH